MPPGTAACGGSCSRSIAMCSSIYSMRPMNGPAPGARGRGSWRTWGAMPRAYPKLSAGLWSSACCAGVGRGHVRTRSSSVRISKSACATLRSVESRRSSTRSRVLRSALRAAATTRMSGQWCPPRRTGVSAHPDVRCPPRRISAVRPARLPMIRFSYPVQLSRRNRQSPRTGARARRPVRLMHRHLTVPTPPEGDAPTPRSTPGSAGPGIAPSAPTSSSSIAS